MQKLMDKIKDKWSFMSMVHDWFTTNGEEVPEYQEAMEQLYNIHVYGQPQAMDEDQVIRDQLSHKLQFVLTMRNHHYQWPIMLFTPMAIESLATELDSMKIVGAEVSTHISNYLPHPDQKTVL